MPSRVKFQTEYMSTFGEHDADPPKVCRSPILKPRMQPNPASDDYKQQGPARDAGLRSLETHITLEPPLQHRHIADYSHNHNTHKTDTTAWINGGKRLQNNGNDKNPILDYEEAVRKTKNIKDKKVEKQNDVNTIKGSVSEKYAGRESDNLRYIALEPPMQRKRRSPCKFNHNILLTNTEDYVNGSEKHSKNASTQSAESLAKVSNTERALNTENKFVRKLFEENKATKASSPAWDESNKNDNTRKSLRTPTQEKNERHVNRISPVKIQRKKDLDDIKTKQDQRVDRALQIKAGLQTIEQPLYSHPVKSEYQRQFAWKEPVVFTKSLVAASPDALARGEPNTYIGKVKRKPREFKTEYQEEFKKYELSTDLITNHQELESKKLHAGKDEQTDIDSEMLPAKEHPTPDKRLVQTSQNVQPLFFPHSGHSHHVTEYEANFQSPKKFQVDNGVWKNAAPPHLYPCLLPEKDTDDTDWFKQVLQLREKAEEYKERSRETHYPTTFPASLDGSSRSSSVSLENGHQFIAQSVKEGQAHKPSTKDSQPLTVAQKLEQEDDNIGGLVVMDDRDESVARKEDRPIANEAGLAEAPASDSNSSGSADERMDLFKGRIDTARLAASNEYRRHNLDRTTPVRAGTVASPAKKLSAELAAPLHDFRTLNQGKNTQTLRSAWEASSPKTKRESRQLTSEKNPFSQSERANVILESKRPTTGKHKHYDYNRYKDKENQELVLSDMKPIHDPDEDFRVDRLVQPPKAFVQPSNIGRTYAMNKASPYLDDHDDLFSETSMSARGSVISDVLERSRLRRDDFW